MKWLVTPVVLIAAGVIAASPLTGQSTPTRDRPAALDLYLPNPRDNPLAADGKSGPAVVDLTATEYALLGFLVEHRDRAVSRFDIVNAVWGDDADVFPRTVDTHVANLRKKIQRDPSSPRHIVGVRGVGYRFAE